MDKTLRVLIIEDSEDDTLLILRELRRSGYEPRHERVDTPQTVTAALAAAPWDVVISDYAMPYFSGLDALALVRASGHDLPFLLVSGAIGEETAVAAMKGGAHDYIMKDRMSRLGAAVTRELRDAEARHARRRAEEELRSKNADLTGILAGFPDLYFWLDLDGTIRRYHAGAPTIVPPEQFLNKRVQDVLPKPVGQQFHEGIARLVATGDMVELEYPLPLADGEHWYEARLMQLLGKQILLAVRDISVRKQMEDGLRQAKEVSEAALAHVRQLQGLLPICSYCKRVRDDRDYWHHLETYVKAHADVRFSHGICPDCWITEIQPQLDEADVKLPPKKPV